MDMFGCMCNCAINRDIICLFSEVKYQIKRREPLDSKNANIPFFVRKICTIHPILMYSSQGVRNRRKIHLTRPALPYDYTFILCILCIRNIRIDYCIRVNCHQSNISYSNGIPSAKHVYCIIIWQGGPRQLNQFLQFHTPRQFLHDIFTCFKNKFERFLSNLYR